MMEYILRKSVFLLIVISSLFSSISSFAAYIECDVTNYEIISGDENQKALEDTPKLYFFEKSGNTTNETINGCANRDVNEKFIQIKIVTRKGDIQEITKCETQNHEVSLNDSHIRFSNYNDHDAPEEKINLFQTGTDTYVGELISSWDAVEHLKLDCKKVY